MRPIALHLSRYRAFDKELTIKLLPITVVIGRNGGGKSVLSRLPMLLSGGLRDLADAPLSLETDGLSHANRYEDLVFQRSAQPFSLGATIAVNGVEATFITTLRHVVETHSLGIETFELLLDGISTVKMNLSDPLGFAQEEARYHVTVSGNDLGGQKKVVFAGLLPSSVDDVQTTSLLAPWMPYFRQSFASPTYLGPFRSETGALARVPRQGTKSLGSRGEGALDLLGDDMLRGAGRMSEAVQRWFDEEMSGSSIWLQRDASFPRVLVHDPIRNLDVELGETGAGFAQLFPVVVQAIALRSRTISSEIAIVEQPELHLHPVAHGAVADLIIDTVLQRSTEISYIVETHSEQFITRLRRRVAEGKVDPADIQILSVGHISGEDEVAEPLRVINLDKDGSPSSWPLGVFDEAFDDLRYIRQAILNRDTIVNADADTRS